MRAYGFRSFGGSEKIEELELPKPEIGTPDDILVRVRAVALNQADSARTLGYSRLIETVKLPVIFGYDFAGEIDAVGSSVTEFKAGDKVYGFNMTANASAELMLLSPASKRNFRISKIPEGLSFEQAASLPVSAHTAIQALTRIDSELPGGLKGKTVFVTAGLGGIGCVALQLLKPVFGAGKVITTLSTGKINLLPTILGDGLVDQVVDYTKEDVIAAIGPGSVDFILDTIMSSMSYLPLLRKGEGVVVGEKGKSGDTLIKEMPDTPWLLVKLLNIVDAVYKWRARRLGVRYEHADTRFIREDSEMIEKLVVEKKLKTVLEATKIDNLIEVRKMWNKVASGKGAVGKYVVML
ncbi:chaperonin 10-like protein [Bisporella sp. PMI_857]|nr:chaperonin 10-like protein [Bisporella sp. PMI_857]